MDIPMLEDVFSTADTLISLLLLFSLGYESREEAARGSYRQVSVLLAVSVTGFISTQRSVQG